jgi:hypothetical protein
MVLSLQVLPGRVVAFLRGLVVAIFQPAVLLGLGTVLVLLDPEGLSILLPELILVEDEVQLAHAIKMANQDLM